jgi:acetyl esterase/lipase
MSLLMGGGVWDQVFKDQIHGFQMMGDLTPATQQALDSAASFLRDVNL